MAAATSKPAPASCDRRLDTRVPKACDGKPAVTQLRVPPPCLNLWGWENMDKEAEIPKRPDMKGAWGEQDFRNLRAGWVPPGSSHWTKSSSFWRGSKSPAFFISAASQVSSGACSGGGGGPLKAAQCRSSVWASPTSPRSLSTPPPRCLSSREGLLFLCLH